MVDCGDACRWIGGKQTLCRAKRDCVCNSCATFRAISPNLYQSCMAACNVDDATKRPTSRDNFLKTFDPYDLFTRYGIVVEGFDPNKTFEAVKNQEAQAKTDAQQSSLGKVLMFGGVGLLLVMVYFFLKK